MSAGSPPGKLVVVKVGGDVLLDERQRAGLGKNVRDLVDDGCQVVVLHGGGPQVTALQERVGLKANKIAGRRVTTKEDLVVVVQAICGEVNVGLCAALIGAGVRAFGCHGASGRLVTATKRPPMQVAGLPDPVDYGEVGDVVGVDAALLRSLLALSVVPVVGTLGVDDGGRIFNINADTTAVQIAKALGADLLLLVTAVGGVFQKLDDPSTRIASLTPARGKALIADGTIAGGMIPKVEEALSILDEGVGAVAIMGAQDAGAFRSALSGDGARGTRFCL
ncbi:MAG: acetylglutamate kinase [Deltaproteobacteria bacterium]|nr:acetylglutamate kinase [Deltaproteobacteria bacterium]